MTDQAPKKKTRAWKPQFLEAFANSCNVRASCQAAGISRGHAYAARKKDSTFAAAWDQAEEDGIEGLEAAARQRAMTTSDTLMIFLLKSHRPERYRDRYTHDVNLGGQKDGKPVRIEVNIMEPLGDDD